MTSLRVDVEPRVISPRTGDRMPLIDAIENVLLLHATGCIALVGDPVETHFALEAIRDRVDPRVCILFEPYAHDVQSRSRSGFVLFSAKQNPEWADLRLRLMPWDNDDILDYLLNHHPAECADVFKRIQSCRPIWRPTTTLVWKEVIGHLARSPAMAGPEAVVENHVRFLLREPKHFQLAYEWAEAVFANDAERSAQLYARLSNVPEIGVGAYLFRDIVFVRMILLMGWTLTLRKKQLPSVLRLDTNFELLTELGRRLSEEPQTVEFLKRANSHPVNYQAVVASLLRRVDLGWRPKGAGWWNFCGADLAGVAWEGIEFKGTKRSLIEFGAANLARANFRWAKLTHVFLHNAILRRADFRNAKITECTASNTNASESIFCDAYFSLFEGPGVDFSEADLRRANFNIVNLSSAILHRARLEEAILYKAAMNGADLREADLRGARLEEVSLSDANLAYADFRDAYFELVRFDQCDFRRTELSGACFKACWMQNCNLEGVQMPRAFFQGSDLSNVWLSDSVMPEANFRDAKFFGAGLGGVQWENADLRGADLRCATFHFGSTRCGLVNSPYPSHGTRTGFYTDEFYEYPGKSVEEIRTANLRGADLRGAELGVVDFYLVDLRDARFDLKHLPHLRRCRAILS
jgi:uncharacterized protein YjbI with pentapeptide repeats